MSAERSTGQSVVATDAAAPIYAGVWRRISAYVLDCALLGSALALPQLLVFTLAGRSVDLQTGLQVELWVFVTISLPCWLYFSLAEHSPRQATLGKRWLGMRVTSVAGTRITFGQAILRTVVKLLPWELTHLTVLLPTPMWSPDSPAGFRSGLVAVYALLGLYVAATFLNRRRQSIDDWVARTVIVRG